MNVVDSCGWLEYFADGTNAGFFAAAVEDSAELVVPTITLFEVFKRVLQQRSENDALRAVAAMQRGRVVPLEAALALSAAKLSCEMKLPMADSIILTVTRTYDATLWTQDADFASIPGVRYIVKGDAR